MPNNNPGDLCDVPGPPSLESLLSLLQQLTASGLLAHAARPIPFEQFRAEVLALYTPPLRARGTWYHMRQALEILAGLGVRSTADFTDDLVVRFVTGEHAAGRNPNGTHAVLAYIRAAINYAASKKYVQASPFATRRRWVRKVSPPAPTWHSRESIARVLSRAQEDVARKRTHSQAGPWAEWRAHRLYALAATVAYTGLRKSEALHLRVEDLLFPEKIILIRSRRDRGTKTEASAQPVPMPSPLVEILRGWVPNLAIPTDRPPVPARFRPRANPEGTPDPGWVFPNSYHTGPWLGGSPGRKPLDCLVSLGNRAGVPGFTFLSLRHSWATNAEYWGLSEVQIQRMLRHTNTRTQSYYRHAEASNLRAMVQGVGFGHELEATEAAAERIASKPALPLPLSLPLPSAVAVPRDDPRACGPKLTLETAAELRRLREQGWSYARLMKRYGISKATVHYAVKGTTWKAPGSLQEPLP